MCEDPHCRGARHSKLRSIRRRPLHHHPRSGPRSDEALRPLRVDSEWAAQGLVHREEGRNYKRRYHGLLPRTETTQPLSEDTEEQVGTNQGELRLPFFMRKGERWI